jgi:hypothetical protein
MSTANVAVKQSLANAGIKKALIIDDAYDTPTRGTLERSLLPFWTRVERDDDALKELRTLDPEVSSEAGLTDELIAKLWDLRDSFAKLKPALSETLFPLKIGDQTQLKYLIESLKELGVEPICLKSEEDPPEEEFKLIFLDYFLGGVGEEGVANSKGRARELYEKAATGDRPFIVLMSSKAEVGSSADMFRETSGLVRGLFGWLSKQDFAKKEVLYFHLASWAFGMPARHEIQHFVETLEHALPKVNEEFKRYVRALGFEDYANIQSFCLQEEGQPLGEYMLWLYKGLLGHLLHTQPAVRELQRKLDQMEFDAFTPNQTSPSLQLAEIYGFAVTEPNISPVGPHPRDRKALEAMAAKAVAPANNETAPVEQVHGSIEPTSNVAKEETGKGGREPDDDEADFVPMFLSLGDLFFKDASTEVLAVINGACDLSFAPNTKRKISGRRSVLFLHGTLERYDQLSTSEGTRTELLKHEGHAYRIAWSRDRVTTVPFRSIEDWLRGNMFERRARLSLPYALQIQQAFAAATMRMGMPARPPVYRRVPVAIYGVGVDGGYKQYGHVTDGAVMISRRQENKPDEDTFVFTLNCVLKIISTFDEIEAECSSRKVALEVLKMAAEETERASAKKAAAELTVEKTFAEKAAADGVATESAGTTEAMTVAEVRGALVGRSGKSIPKTTTESPDAVALKAARGRVDAIQKKLSGLAKLKLITEMWEASMHRPMALPIGAKSKNLGDQGLVYVFSCILDGEFLAAGPVALRLVLDEAPAVHEPGSQADAIRPDVDAERSITS